MTPLSGVDVSVAVVIPTYNAREYVADAIDSVLSQRRVPDEILVVDDGSQDGTSDLVRERYPNVTVLRQRNKGVASARNLGIASTSCAWVALLDADDVWHESKLHRQVEAIVAGPSDLCCVHTGYYYFGARNGEGEVPAAVSIGDYRLRAHFHEWMVIPSSALIRRDCAGSFPVGLHDGEDTIFFASLGLRGVFSYIDEPLTGYRKHGQSRSDSPWSIVRSRINGLEWLRGLAASEPQLADECREATAQMVEDLGYRLRRARFRRDVRDYLRWAQVLTKYDVAGHVVSTEPVLIRPVVRLSQWVPRRIL